LLVGQRCGITNGMKTAISVPDEVFEKAEATAKRLQISRSELYSRALREFLDSHSPDRVTSGWDAVIEEVGQPETSISAGASRGIFEKTEW
jgi:metal-responsive CopG/Arc/MetJ family transcriptional regulator